MKTEPVITGDGSHTLFVPELKEHYHSTFGAIAESRHIFINAGFHGTGKKDRIDILEIGFGTGLNALLTLAEPGPSGLHVDYTSIEADPLEKEQWEKLNYPEKTGIPGAPEYFTQIHEADWDRRVDITDHFSLHKINTRLEDYAPPPSSFDLIYFDAFGPGVQPELWTQAVFEKMFTALKAGGLLVTYSAKGSVRRAMLAAGFTVERLPGPPGKREFLRAKNSNIEY